MELNDYDYGQLTKMVDIFEREILYYWAIEGMTAQEISRQIDTPRGTVLSRLYRLRKKFETDSEQSVGGYVL